MKPADVHALAVAAGLAREQAIIATAIAWAESGLRPDAVGDVDLQDDKWGPSVGLYQVRSLRADTGTGRPRDIERLGDPSFNTKAMVAISAGGTNWQPWSVWKNGRYLTHIDAVRAAVAPGGHTMKIVSRSEWGARTRRGSSAAPGMDRGVGVHWLGDGGAPQSHDQCAGTMRWVQAQHMDTDQLATGGAADFAYNAGACPHGYVYEGRGPRIRNAANGGGTRSGVDANAGWGSILYFDAASDGLGLTPEGRDAINDAAEWLGVADGEWLGHRDFLNTSCPGDRTYGWVHSGHPRGTGSTPEPDPLPEPEPQEEDDDMPKLIGVTNDRGIFMVGTTPLATKKSGGRIPAVYIPTPDEVTALVESKVATRDEDAPDLPEAVFNRRYIVVG